MSERWERVEELEIRARGLEKESAGLGDSLCSKCTRASIFRRKEQSTVNIYCHDIEKIVPSDISECSRFEAQNAMTLQDMERLAHIIDARPMPGQHI